MTSVKSLSKKPSSLWPVVKTMFPHVHAELFTFPCLLSGYFGGIKLIRNSAPSLWPVHKSKNTTFIFSLSYASQPHFSVCRCLMPSNEMPRLPLESANVSVSQRLLSVVFSWFCEYTSETVDIYRFALCRSGMLVKIWRDEGSTLISQSTVETVQSFSLFLVNKAQIA